jgi:hypothetical protein
MGETRQLIDLNDKRLLAVLVALLILSCGGVIGAYFAGYWPGSVHFDERGIPHGTGWIQYSYDTGELMLEEYYVAGRIAFSRWYRPDGSTVAETEWRDGTGMAYFLRQDGTVRVKIACVGGVAHGTATHFNEVGHVIKTTVFRNGIEFEQEEH